MPLVIAHGFPRDHLAHIAVGLKHMTKSTLKLVSPATANRTVVTPTPLPQKKAPRGRGQFSMKRGCCALHISVHGATGFLLRNVPANTPDGQPSVSLPQRYVRPVIQSHPASQATISDSVRCTLLQLRRLARIVRRWDCNSPSPVAPPFDGWCLHCPAFSTLPVPVVCVSL
jgi:hypothetical protein